MQFTQHGATQSAHEAPTPAESGYHQARELRLTRRAMANILVPNSLVTGRVNGLLSQAWLQAWFSYVILTPGKYSLNAPYN